MKLFLILHGRPEPSKTVFREGVMELLVIAVLFALSLLAAIVLFAFFKSYAIIKTKQWQAGGAIAGFVIVFLILFSSFSKLNGYDKTINADKEKIASMNARIQALQQFVTPREIKGTVSPPTNQTKLLLVFQAANTDLKQDGRFQMLVPCVDPSHDPLTFYVLTPGGRFVQYGIDDKQNLTELNYTVP